MARPSDPGARDVAPGQSHYRKLRAVFEAALVMLYERTALPVRDIASIAGRTGRDIYIQVRRLGCRPRHAKSCRPGVSVGERRKGRRAKPLDAVETAAAAEALRRVARALRCHADTRVADELQRASERAQRRTARAAERMLLEQARSIRHAAVALEATTAMRAGARRDLERTSRSSRRLTRQDKLARRISLESGMAGPAAWWAARETAPPVAAPAAATPPVVAPAASPTAGPAPDAETARRIDEAAEQDRAPEQDKGPRIRRLW